MAADAMSHDDPHRDRAGSAHAGRAHANLPSSSLPSANLPSDPLQRLEVELGEQDGVQSGDERLYQEAQGLVEEAWSVLTECLGIRDGLLEACQEVEQAMSHMQRRLGALSVAIDADADTTQDANAQAGGSESIAIPRALVNGVNDPVNR